MATVPFNKVRGRMMADPEFRKEYDALGEKFALIEAMVEARTQANMTQADVAKAMGVSQPPGGADRIREKRLPGNPAALRRGNRRQAQDQH